MIRKLTDRDLSDLVGAILHGYHVEDARIKQGSFSDSDHYGIILGRNANGNYVTWQFHFDDEELSVYWGHYLADKDAALHDFNTRDLGIDTDNTLPNISEQPIELSAVAGEELKSCE